MALGNCVICEQIERSNAAAVVATSDRLCDPASIKEWKRLHPESSFYKVVCTSGTLKEQKIDSLKVSDPATIKKSDLETLDDSSEEVVDK